MTYDNKPFVPQGFKQIKKEYMETPFWLGKFLPGAQFTIVEDIGISKTMRYTMRPSTKGGPAFPVYLIKITDGFVEKDLELSKGNAQILFRNLPDNIINLKGVTLANDMGRWIFVSQTDTGLYNKDAMPKSAEIAKSMEPAPEAPTEIGNQIKALHAAMQTNSASGITNSFKVVLDIADKMRPGDALALITEAKKQGWITERIVDGVTTYRAE